MRKPLTAFLLICIVGCSIVWAKTLFDAGTTALPSISFADDPTTGMSLPAPGFWDFSVSGERQMRLFPNMMYLGDSVSPYTIRMYGPNGGTEFADFTNDGSDLIIRTGGGSNIILEPIGDVVEQKRGEHSQVNWLYNRYENNINHERFNLEWTNNEMLVYTDSAGNGVGRNMKLGAGSTLSVQIGTDKVVSLINGGQFASMVVQDQKAPTGTTRFVCADDTGKQFLATTGCGGQ